VMMLCLGFVSGCSQSKSEAKKGKTAAEKERLRFEELDSRLSEVNNAKMKSEMSNKHNKADKSTPEWVLPSDLSLYTHSTR